MAFVLNGPVTAVFVFTGVLLNLITVFVLVNPPKRSCASANNSTIKRALSLKRGGSLRAASSARPIIYTYLLWIAFSDTTLLLNAFLMYCVPSFMSSLGFYARLFPTYYMLSNASLTASVWLMCALMFDRYRALCRPLSIQAQQMSVAHVHKILTAVVLVAVIFSLPRLFELALFEYEGEVYVRQTFLVENRFYMIGYRIVGGLLFYSLFPYIGLFTMSTRISFAMHAASKERQRLASGSQKSRRKSSDSELILLAVMAKFLLSRLMPTALDVAEHIVSAKEFLNSPTATICVDISNLLVVISSATNFFIYCAFSRSFRRVVRPRFAGCLCCLGKAVHEKGRRRRHISLRRTMSSNSSACSSKLCDMNNSTRICAPLLAADFPLRRTEVLI